MPKCRCRSYRTAQDVSVCLSFVWGGNSCFSTNMPSSLSWPVCFQDSLVSLPARSSEEHWYFRGSCYISAFYMSSGDSDWKPHICVASAFTHIYMPGSFLYIDLILRDWGDGCSSRASGFNSQNLHGKAQLSLTPVPSSVPSSGFCMPQAHMWS